nr:BON domain-containing protein [Planctomycetota bacterium]
VEQAAPAPTEPTAAPAEAEDPLAVWQLALDQALAADPALAAAVPSPQLMLIDGVVTIVGIAKTTAAKNRAMILAFRATGGKRVANLIEIDPDL